MQVEKPDVSFQICCFTQKHLFIFIKTTFFHGFVPMGFAHTLNLFLRPYQQVIRPVLNSY